MKIAKIIKNRENGRNSELRKNCCLKKKLCKNFGPQKFSLATRVRLRRPPFLQLMINLFKFYLPICDAGIPGDDGGGGGKP